MTGSFVDFIWVAPALALLGFVLNGTIAFVRPNAKTLVSVVGAGVLLVAAAMRTRPARRMIAYRSRCIGSPFCESIDVSEPNSRNVR